MYSIGKIYKNEIVIQKSRFICLLIPINNPDIKDMLLEMKKQYKDATHYCYAFITKGKEKYSDDGEPSGTAGNPILNVLKKRQLEDVLAVVIRYFGGIKLGAGGLIRAYTKAVTDCLSISNLIIKEEMINLEIICSYDKVNLLFKVIDDIYIKSKQFRDHIELTVCMPFSQYTLIKKQLKDICLSVTEKRII